MVADHGTPKLTRVALHTKEGPKAVYSATSDITGWPYFFLSKASRYGPENITENSTNPKAAEGATVMMQPGNTTKLTEKKTL